METLTLVDGTSSAQRSHYRKKVPATSQPARNVPLPVGEENLNRGCGWTRSGDVPSTLHELAELPFPKEMGKDPTY